MDLFTILSLIGSAAFALSGYVVGVRKNLDIMGVFIVSMLPAYGGGAIRDVLLGRSPAVLDDPTAFLLVCTVVIGATLLGLNKSVRIENKGWFIISDSIGLVAFAITGALMGIEADLSLFGVMVLGFVTAAGGGILRDILVNDTPALLKNDIYGSVALAAGAAMYSLNHLDLTGEAWIFAVFIAGLMVRLAAHRLGWRLPRL